jgi:hypothetical protein
MVVLPDPRRAENDDDPNAEGIPFIISDSNF